MGDSKPYFEQVASDWDAMRSEFFSERVREKAHARAALQAGQVAVDVGAGSGFMSTGLVERGVRVIAVDQSPAMLAELQARLGEGVETRVGETGALPVEPGSADVVLANMYLHHTEDPPAAIAEMAGLLKPGGRLLLSDVNAHDHEWLRTEHHDRWLGFAHEDVRGWFEAGGLSGVTVEDIGET